MKWDGKQLKIDRVKHPLKLTATRFASVLGLNPWSSPFKTWCEITKTYREPYEDTIYTLAGKAIEPKQAEYIRDIYGAEVVTPTDKYGADYFKLTHGDFFPAEPIFGGMWDYLGVEDGKVTTVYEMKTTKRAEDWSEETPIYYRLQAALYAYLLGVEDFVLVGTFLDVADYAHPENFEVNSKNTVIRRYKLSKEFPHFDLYVASALNWWESFVNGCISPEYAEGDEDIVKILKTTTVDSDADMNALLEKLDKVKIAYEESEKRSKAIKDEYNKLCKSIKGYLTDHLTDDYNRVTLTGDKYIWTLSRSESEKLDNDAIKADGLWDKYKKTDYRYTLTAKEKE